MKKSFAHSLKNMLIKVLMSFLFNYLFTKISARNLKNTIFFATVTCRYTSEKLTGLCNNGLRNRGKESLFISLFNHSLTKSTSFDILDHCETRILSGKTYHSAFNLVTCLIFG